MKYCQDISPSQYSVFSPLKNSPGFSPFYLLSTLCHLPRRHLIIIISCHFTYHFPLLSFLFPSFISALDKLAMSPMDLQRIVCTFFYKFQRKIYLKFTRYSMASIVQTERSKLPIQRKSETYTKAIFAAFNNLLDQSV